MPEWVEGQGLEEVLAPGGVRVGMEVSGWFIGVYNLDRPRLKMFFPRGLWLVNQG